MKNGGRVNISSGFGALLRRHRLAAGLSQQSLAERARMSVDGISALERGYRKTPQFETLTLLAGALALNEDEKREFVAAAQPRVLRGRGSVTVGPWPSAGSTNLPFALTRFIGREAELGEIAALLDERRLVTITGAAGVGKTQTALRVAAAGDDVVAFVALAPVGDAELVPLAVALAVGVQQVPNHPILETLVANLRSKRILLILDNCEHVLTGAASISETLLRGCPRVRILATSREPLQADGERRYRLPSLNAEDSVRLFADRAQAIDARFQMNDENRAKIAEICRKLDGIALAIELAAARVNVLSIEKLAEMLNDRFTILTGTSETALPRHRTMRAAIDWSFELLSEEEQRLFERLAIFVGGCTVTTAIAVCADVDVPTPAILGLLSSLVDKSLVVADLSLGEPRYWLLESFKEYALEKLATRAQKHVIAQRHAWAFLDVAESLGRAFEFEGYAAWGPRLREERDNFNTALQWSLTNQGDAITGQRIISELVNAYLLRLEGRHWLSLAMELINETTPRSVLAALDLARATIARNELNYKAELTSSENALVRYRALGDALGIARALSRKGHALLFLGERAAAQTAFTESLAVARTVGARHHQSIVDALRSLALAHNDDIAAARKYVAEALQILAPLGDRHHTAAALIDLAACEFSAGNVDVALGHAKDALDMVRLTERAHLTAIALSDVAVYLSASDRWNEAAGHARESLQLASENDFSMIAAWNMLHLAAITVLQPENNAGHTPDLYARSARLLGFVDAVQEAAGSAPEPIHEQERRRALSVLREMLGAEVVAALMTEGAALTEEQAVTEALNL